jgi:hypothetical protein
MTVEVSFTANTAFDWSSLTVIEFTGYDTGTPTGVTLAALTGSRSGSYSPSLSGTSSSDSYVVAGGYADDGTATKGAAWTEAHDFAALAGFAHGNIEYIEGAVSAANWAALDSIWSTSAVAVEIKAAGGGGGFVPYPRPRGLFGGMTGGMIGGMN